MKKWFHNFPIELWLIGIPSIALLFFVSAFYYIHGKPSPSFINGIVNSFMGGRFLTRALTFIYSYAVLRSLYGLTRSILKKHDPEKLVINILVTARSIMFWSLLVAIATVSFADILTILFYNVTPAHIESASNMLLHADLNFFKIYPARAINALLYNHPVLEGITLNSYIYLAYVVSATFVVLIFSDTKLFRRFFISFVLTGMIALPFWYFIPATSPRGYVEKNIFSEQRDTGFQKTFTSTPSPQIAKYLPVTDKTWIDPKMKSFNISSFPSMHAAWSLLVLLSLTLLFPPLIFILLPWLLALLIGAVGVYQHYVMDIIAGLILGGMVFSISGAVLRHEHRVFRDKYKLMKVFEIIENDFRNVGHILHAPLPNIFKK